MNKFTKYDIHNGTIQLKCAIMNTIADIDNGVEIEINLGLYIPINLLLDCLNEAKWRGEIRLEKDSLCSEFVTPNMKRVLIQGGAINKPTVFKFIGYET